ncbi:MAG TPA: cobalamin biosynthesis protein [Streptosporangiaceae bacterium]|nr:cobalamin biosynthesis protein [Streptosporangiaceae bacterium]
MDFGFAKSSGACKRARPSRWPLAAGLVVGVVLDAVFGDPEHGHPVAGFGRAAAVLEARDYAPARMRGAAHAAACVAPVAVLSALIDHRLARRPLIRLIAIGAAAWSVIGARSLRRLARQVGEALADDDLAAARAILPSLCGRDPATLDAKGMARAVVESVAENTSDAVVAPLFWGAVAGLPGLVAYRAVNTLDAMVGHRSPRYQRFGWASARLDDAANWIPARLTALLTVACSPLVAAGSGAAAWRALRDYGGRHPSPNAGRCEAAFAGALGLRLGGTNVYDGVADPRPHLGDGRAPEPTDIRHANDLSRTVTVAATIAAVVMAFRPRAGRRR